MNPQNHFLLASMLSTSGSMNKPQRRFAPEVDNFPGPGGQHQRNTHPSPGSRSILSHRVVDRVGSRV